MIRPESLYETNETPFNRQAVPSAKKDRMSLFAVVAEIGGQSGLPLKHSSVAHDHIILQKPHSKQTHESRERASHQVCVRGRDLGLFLTTTTSPRILPDSPGSHLQR